MKKPKTLYICQNCGYESVRWLGKCTECGTWDSLVEQVIKKEDKFEVKNLSLKTSPKTIKNIEYDKSVRKSTGIKELDLVLGGGLVNGALILVGGDPGIGKSTLLLQSAYNLAKRGEKVLYVSGEESAKQTKIRAERLKADDSELLVLSENNISEIVNQVALLKPTVLIVDSVQTVYSSEISSSPGSVSQVREATAVFMSLAKKEGIATFLVGHVTKSGSIAGPKLLEHMVDTVLYFEGEQHNVYRILRAVKNRFGSTNEIGIFEMTNRGLEEVNNPSKLFLSDNPILEPGSMITPIIEGSRTVLVEIQCLVSHSNFNMPRRMAMGLDHNRLILLTAILEKKMGMQLYDQDIYLNVVGGMMLNEPSADLSVILSVASSFKNIKICDKTVVLGEVGLTGEVRAINQSQMRVNEAAKLGYTTCVLPQGNMQHIEKPKGMMLIGVKTVSEAIEAVLVR